MWYLLVWPCRHFEHGFYWLDIVSKMGKYNPKKLQLQHFSSPYWTCFIRYCLWVFIFQIMFKSISNFLPAQHFKVLYSTHFLDCWNYTLHPQVQSKSNTFFVREGLADCANFSFKVNAPLPDIQFYLIVHSSHCALNPF